MKRYQAVLLSIFSAFLLSLPWLHILPGFILLVALVPLLILNDKLNDRNNSGIHINFLGYAFLTFFLWNLITTWWIFYASVTGMFIIITCNAFIMSVVWWLFNLISRRYPSKMADFTLIVLWLGLEYLQYNWPVEWPWLTLGNGFANNPKLIQWYEYTGVLGGSFWILVSNILIFRFYKVLSTKRFGLSVRSLFFIFLFILAPSIYSVIRYNNYVEKGDDYDIAVLQPNVDPYQEKFVEDPEEQLLSLLELTDSLLTNDVDYVLGPETALHPLWENDSITNHPYIYPFYERTLNRPKLKIVLGATTKVLYNTYDEIPATARKKDDTNQYYDVFNSALQIDHTGIIQTYHKSKLVSGVEKMPFSKYLKFMNNLIVDLGGTTGSLGSQKEPSVFASDSGTSIAPVICYESIFGEYVTKYIRKGAKLIFVMTNDGWWKNSPGVSQHLSYARLRAIETRRSIARSANTGISAFINQRGDIISQTKLGKKTGLKGNLKANDKITFYTIYGDYIGRISAFIAALLLLYYLSRINLTDRFN